MQDSGQRTHVLVELKYHRNLTWLPGDQFYLPEHQHRYEAGDELRYGVFILIEIIEREMHELSVTDQSGNDRWKELRCIHATLFHRRYVSKVL